MRRISQSLQFRNTKTYLLHNQKHGPTASNTPGGNTIKRNTDRKGTSEVRDISAEKPEQNRNLLKMLEFSYLIQGGKTGTNLKFAGKELKEAEKVKDIVEKKRIHTEGQSRPGGKKKWWTCQHALTSKLSPLTILLIAGFMTKTDSASFSCVESQTGELGARGTINCSFLDTYQAVHWYDDVRPGSSPFISHTNTVEDKTEFCLESENYDVAEDGSLIICKVAVLHEKNYTVFVVKGNNHEEHTVSFKVIVYPVDDLPMISCHNCHQEYYHSAEQGDILSCSFNATRPPVQLEWFKKLGDGYEHLEMQQFSTTENSNGTFNSLATVHLLQGSSNLTQLLVCRATWPLSEWRREREILLDFSSNVSFSDVTPKIQHMEINRYAEIQCVQSTSDYVVWKRNLPNSEPELIGLHSHQMTETISDISDVKVSAEGSLIFASPRVQHEGMYVRISGDGQNEEIQMTSVEILIPPSPPYIQITGCDDSYRCVFREDSTNKLTCAVYGARPNVTLEWIAKNEGGISFFNHKLVSKERGDTFNTILSVEYEVSQNVLCGEEILITCRLNGPLSNIIKAESTALVIPASCKKNGGKKVHGHGGIVIALVILCLIVTGIADCIPDCI